MIAALALLSSLASALPVQAAPADAEAWWELGWTRYAAADFGGAIGAWAEVSRLEPTHPELEMWLAVARAREQWEHTPVPVAPVPTVRPEGPTVRFAAVGDTMMGSDLMKGEAGLSPDNGAALFDATRDDLRSVDVAFLNLEGPLADLLPSQKCAPGSTDCHAFRTPTRYVSALTGAGIDVAQLSNNHAMDLGADGMASSMRTLDAAGIAHAGRYGDIAHLERHGLKIAVVGAHSGSCCLNDNDIDEVSRAVAWADQEADLVLFVFHGGAEGAAARHVEGKVEVAWGEPRGDVRALAHAAVDAGADLVIGTGPHVLRAMEVYRSRLVAYSLGNYTGYRQFGTQGGYGGTTVLLEAELAMNGVLVSAKLHPLALDGESVPHVDLTGAAYAQIRELSDADFPGSGVTIAADGTLSWR